MSARSTRRAVRSGRRVGRRLAALAAAAALAAGCASSSPAARLGGDAEALRQLGVRRGRLAWDGLVTGMTFSEVEAAVGRRLPSPSLPDDALGCAHPAVTTELLGRRLGLEFSGGTESARLVAIDLVLAAPEHGQLVEGEALKAAVRAQVPGLEFLPSVHAPDRGEADAVKALYRAPNGELVFVNPARGVYFGEVCVD